MTPGTMVRVALCAVLMLGIAPPATAQFGGIVNKVKGKVESTVRKEVSKHLRDAAPVYNEHVLEMTPAVLDRFTAALEAEGAGQAEMAQPSALPGAGTAAAASRSSQRAAADWYACVAAVRSRANYMQRQEEHVRRAAAVAEQVQAGKADPAAATRAGAELAALLAEINAVQTSTCGAQPAVTPTDPVAALPADQRPRVQPVPAALAAGEFTETQYSILKERVVPFCAASRAGGGDGVRIPGEGDAAYVYSRAEVEALQPRCARLQSLLLAVL